MSLRVVADENMPAVEAALGDAAVVTRVAGRGLTARQLRDADVLLVRSVTTVDESLLGGTRVRFVGTATSGIDHIDRNWLESRRIGFAAAPGANANSVVEYVLAAIAAVDDHLDRLLAGGRVGIVGYGHVGKLLVSRLTALGIESRVSDPWLARDAIPNASELDEVLTCDVVCLHPELTLAQPWPSRHLVGPVELARMTSEQLLINASRGPVVDNTALLDRLNGSGAPAVVLDVWENEPVVPDALLSRVTLGTAHIAGYSYDGKVLATRMLCRALAECLGVTLASAAEEEDAAADIQLPAGLTPVESLRQLLESRYRIQEDDRLLREAVHGRAHEQVRYEFDELRKQYRERRELAGSMIKVSAANPEQLALAEALGCKPVTVDM